MSEYIECTLSSLDNLDDSPSNCSFHFCNTFTPPLDVSEGYECAVKSIKFTDDYKKPVQRNPSEIPFYDTGLYQNEISIGTNTLRTLYIEKNERNIELDDFVNSVNVQLEIRDLDLEFLFNIESGRIANLVAVSKPRPDHEFKIFGSLARVLGFEEGKPLGEGEFTNELPIDEDFLKSFSGGTIGRISEISKQTRTVYLDQVMGKPTIDELIADISLKLNETNNVVLHYDETSNSIVYEVNPSDQYITLSWYLRQYLGLRALSTFSGKGRVELSRSAPVFRNDVSTSGTIRPNLMFLTCDVIEPNYYQGKLLKYLLCWDRKETDGPQEVIVDNSKSMIYKSINCESLDRITLKLLDDTCNFVAPTISPTSVKIVLRPKQGL